MKNCLVLDNMTHISTLKKRNLYRYLSLEQNAKGSKIQIKFQLLEYTIQTIMTLPQESSKRKKMILIWSSRNQVSELEKKDSKMLRKDRKSLMMMTLLRKSNKNTGSKRREKCSKTRQPSKAENPDLKIHGILFQALVPITMDSRITGTREHIIYSLPIFDLLKASSINFLPHFDTVKDKVTKNQMILLIYSRWEGNFFGLA